MIQHKYYIKYALQNLIKTAPVSEVLKSTVGCKINIVCGKLFHR